MEPQKEYFKMPETNQSARKIWIACGLYGIELEDKIATALKKWATDHMTTDGKIEWHSNNTKYLATWSAFYTWLSCCCEKVAIPKLPSRVRTESVDYSHPPLYMSESDMNCILSFEPISEPISEPIHSNESYTFMHEPIIIQDDYVSDNKLSDLVNNIANN